MTYHFPNIHLLINRLRTIFLLLFFSVTLYEVAAQSDVPTYITPLSGKGRFGLSVAGKVAPLQMGTREFPGVIRAVQHLQADLQRVTKSAPTLLTETKISAKEVVLIGTLGKNPVIDQLVKEKKLDVKGIAAKWETFLIQVVEKPLPGVDRALVIVGSDKRGTIFGIYDVSAHIGVSPWYWWADVPTRQQANLYVLPGRHTQGEPKVKYRGIFINDEAPALSGWSKEKFGGFNHAFYEHVFELILRLKGNYLWPAMWGNAFYDDYPMNPKLADEYGVVIGTSHHEPLMRAHDEWRRYGSGKWNYQTNEAKLKEFWTEGIRRMGTNESIVSVGMRGDGDEPMTEGTAISLLEKIVADQRKIISDVTGKEPFATPQLWALYKEVQEYYDKGMRVPDDVTLLLCDDNWGNIRKLPKLGEKPRSGGYGIYYHFDYVGGPRNYKWLNTNPISRIWEQMHLAYQYQAKQIWIVNVGDIKPMEFPIEFFLDYAWNPEKWPAERLDEYTKLWAQKQFGATYASAIAEILTNYTKYNSRRKPELLAPDTYSLVNYREAETVVAEYNQLAEKAEAINQALPQEYKDAFYQLVLYPVKACANLNELYVTVAKNKWYAQQGRAATNALADQAKALFDKDAELAAFYNTQLAGGKWSHMMDQTHIGYTYWQQPEKNAMPEVQRIEPTSQADMGVSVEGSEAWWPMETTEATLPELNRYQQPSSYLEVFNRGKQPFDFVVETGVPWVIASTQRGKADTQERITLRVDWNKAPAGKQTVPITITGLNQQRVVVQATINNLAMPVRTEAKGFVESSGYVSMEAEHYTKAIATAPLAWKTIPNLSRTLSGVTPFPVTSPPQTPGKNSPRLEYTIHFVSSGEVKVHAYFSPTLTFNGAKELRYAISIDEEPPQIINLHADGSNRAWEKSVADNINILVSKHQLATSGTHVLKFWMVDPGVVLQKLVVDTGGLKPSYLGPPESFRIESKSK